jgi:serine/threonine protein kinase
MNLPVTAPTANHTFVDWTETDFGLILRENNVEYSLADNYWQAGELKQVQGWILDLSFVLSELPGALEVLVPILIAEDVPFRIIYDQQTATDFVHGYVGIEKIGKMITVFCPTEGHACELAIKLVALTKDLSGPAVLTDRHLGGTVYARYGGFNPVLLQTEKGKKEPHIYAPDGTLVPDTELIPFQLPAGIAWPFERIARVDPPPAKKVLNYVYRPVSVLKEDVRGNVYKGLYLKSLFRVKNCVIKQGKKGMTSDLYGREMHHRLAWQQTLHHNLKNIVPLPEIYDLFIEDGDTYLAMEYINGCSLYEKIKEINTGSVCWQELTIEQRLLILGFVTEIVTVINDLHQEGYVHRDIHPGNFMVDKQNKLYLIDIELAYSVTQAQPTPPFAYGTAGFMSPEQQDIQVPTFKEDIYGIGATMINMFTGFSPVKFEHGDKDRLKANLDLMIGDATLGDLIMQCIDADPAHRPELADILAVLQKHQVALKNGAITHLQKHEVSNNVQKKLTDTINSGLLGLVEEPIIMSNDLWYFKVTKQKNAGVPQMREYTKYPGMRNGMAGVLFVLAKAAKSGLNVAHLRENYLRSKAYLEEYITDDTSDANEGFYDGKAGVGVSLAEGIGAGLLDDNEGNRSLISACFRRPDNMASELTAATGAAGKGLALLYCRKYLDETYWESLITQITGEIIRRQQPSGLWLQSAAKWGKTSSVKASFGEGETGIIWYLLNAYAIAPNEQTLLAVERSLAKLLKKANGTLKGSISVFFDKNNHRGLEGDELSGLLMVLIRAYEILKSNDCRQLVERIFRTLPYGLVHNNFTSWNGLASLGEAYLSAWQVFGDEEWKSRADWLASVYVHLQGQNPKGSAFWMMDESDAPTAGFMTGNSGILHFLIRARSGGKSFYLY